MRAIQVTTLDGPDGLALVELPEPEAADGRVVIEVHAAGVGFPDLLMTRGRYQFRPDAPFVPGIEMAGVVRSAPEGTFAPGERVASWSALGGWAEYALAFPQTTFRIPDDMSFAQATTLVNYQSAYFGLVERGQARAGETVLVHGAAGGVGSAAVDIASGMGMTAVAVAQGEEKLAVARGLGAAHCIDADSSWLEEVRRITDNRGVDLVFDPVGGDRFLDSVRSLAVNGRLLVVGFAGGSIPEVKVNRLLLRNSSVVGVAWGEYVRHDLEMPQRVGRALDELWAKRAIDPLVGPVFPLERAADALREIEERRAVGKVVLAVRN